MAAARFLVSGKVQGVFFRASTREQALRLDLSGSARNLADGRVEVIAAGDAEAIEALERWPRQGPPSAKVIEVVQSSCDATVDAGFVIA
jgi:acylphosphatase